MLEASVPLSDLTRYQPTLTLVYRPVEPSSRPSPMGTTVRLSRVHRTQIASGLSLCAFYRVEFGVVLFGRRALIAPRSARSWYQLALGKKKKKKKKRFYGSDFGHDRSRRARDIGGTAEFLFPRGAGAFWLPRISR